MVDIRRAWVMVEQIQNVPRRVNGPCIKMMRLSWETFFGTHVGFSVQWSVVGRLKRHPAFLRRFVTLK